MPIQEIENQHSEEVEEIITAVPSWILRWGLTVFFMVLIALLLFSALIKMPDTLSGKLKIESVSRPEEIIAHSQGKLTALFVNENSMVDSGTVLGYIESNARPEQVIEIGQVTDQIQMLASSDQLEEISSVSLSSSQHLGELQSSFLIFSQSFIEFRSFLENGFYAQKRRSIQQEMMDLELQKGRLKNQMIIYRQDFAIAEKEFEANKKLLEGKVISPMEYKREESKFINKKIPLENIQSSLLGNSSSKNLKEQEIKELDNQVMMHKAGFLAKVNQFKSEIDNWKLGHVLTAGSKGKVVFNHFIREGDFIESNKPLFYITKGATGKFEGEMMLSQYALGKVRVGQEVVIRLNAFPYQEYGVLKGKITYLSELAIADSLYIARVSFSNEGKTSYQKDLKLKNGLLADAEIVTQKRSLLTKLFSNVYSMFKNE